MTDLLGFDMDYSDELPNDSLSPDGFLNNGATQVTSAVQIENYLKSARKALDYVLLDGQKPETSTSEVAWNKGNLRGAGNKRYLANSSPRLGRVHYWHGSFKEPPREGRLTVRVKASDRLRSIHSVRIFLCPAESGFSSSGGISASLT